MIDRIASTLGVRRDVFDRVISRPEPEHLRRVDGTPDQFEVWADQVLDPEARRRLMKIAAILNKRIDVSR